MIRYFLFFTIAFLTSCKSSYNLQQDKNKGVNILEKHYFDAYEIPKSILFKFTGDTHLVNNFLHLKDRLKAQLDNANIRSAYVYELKSDNPFHSDINKIPKNNVNIDEYDIQCTISLPMESMKQIGNKYLYNFILNLTEVNSNNSSANFVILVCAKNNITTENKNLSKLVIDLVTKQNNL